MLLWCEASKSAVCKINIDSDSRLAMTAAIRKYLAENPGHFDPRQYLKPARENMKKPSSRIASSSACSWPK